jgi:SulP family sulfate permease
MMSTWFVKSYNNTKQKWEWMVAPLIVVLTFVVGMLNAIFLGVALSTFIFVASFYHSGVVKYLANGLTLRSIIERGYREADWLDENGDLIQILVLHNYLFFGNAQSLLSYVSTMFDESKRGDPLIPLPPAPLYIIMDFAIVSGMDTSAVDLLRETITLCKNNRCRLFLSGMSPTLRSNLVYAGIKPDGKTFSFQPDLESSIGKAEDGLLTNVFHVVRQDEQDAGERRRARAESIVDNGFLYALKKIDEQVRSIEDSRWGCYLKIFYCC